MFTRQKAFTLIETLIVMLIMLLVVGLILFIVMFVFNTMDKLHFHLHTISLYENIHSKLEDVFSLWYFDEENAPTNPDGPNSIVFPTKRLILDADTNWIQATPTIARVQFSPTNNTIRVMIDNASSTVFSHEYLNNLEFSADPDDRIVYSTMTFTNLRGDATNVKVSKYRTIN